MSSLPPIAGDLQGSGRKFALVASRYNESTVELLIAGANETLLKHSVEAADIQLFRVPGTWEIAQAAEEVAAIGEVDAVIALGVVVRGETPHFDHLCAECAAALGRVSSKYRLPISFGVLTCDTYNQARERAGGKVGNKGSEAAQAALEMANLFESLRS